ncbi:MAG: TonB-dependent receptor, partial [Casimicrobiaceae bacterium]
QPCRDKGSGSWNENTWTVGVDYQITPDAMVYLAHRKGYKAGGFNTFAPPGKLLFEPETVKDLEVGAKVDWRAGSVQSRTNVAVYNSWFDDIQRSDSFFVGTTLFQFTSNTAKAQIFGVELENTFLFGERLQLDLLYSYTDAGYDDYTDFFGRDLSDLPFAGVPENRVQARAAYTIPLSATQGDLRLSADWSWQDRQSVAPSNDLVMEESDIRAYSLVNARIQWSNLMGSGVDVGVFGTNLADKTYAYGGQGTGDTLGFTGYWYAPPRMWGVDLRYSF